MSNSITNRPETRRPSAHTSHNVESAASGRLAECYNGALCIGFADSRQELTSVVRQEQSIWLVPKSEAHVLQN